MTRRKLVVSYDRRGGAAPVRVTLTRGLHVDSVHWLTAADARELIADLEAALAAVIESHETRVPRNKIKAGGTD